jgi:hypothetical protein
LDHTVKVPLVHGECILAPFARDREPGVRASTTGQWTGGGRNVGPLELQNHFTNEVGLALERDLHAGRNVHRGSVGLRVTDATRMVPGPVIRWQRQLLTALSYWPPLATGRP